jgi:hypothetical protein
MNDPENIDGTDFIFERDFVTINTNCMKCSSETATSLVICRSGPGKLKNRAFRYCGIRGSPISRLKCHVCAALVLMKRGTCENESANCDFEGNVDGTVWIGRRDIFRNCDVVEIEGYYGGLYVNNAVLSLFSCYFECNEDF